MDDFMLDNLIGWYRINIAAKKSLLLSAELRKSALEGLKRGVERVEQSRKETLA